MPGSARALLRHALRNHPGPVAGLLAACLLLALLGAMEGGLRLHAARQAAAPPPAAASPPATNDFSHAVDRDPLLGYRPRPAQVIQDTARHGGRTIYEASYTIDDHGRRMTPGASEDPDAPVVALFGCSFAFGLGVADGEAVGARIAALLPGVRVVNFAVPGYGSQHVWAQLRDPAVEETLRGRRGVAVYLFVDHHLERLVGSRNLERSWRISLPCLELENGHVVHRGTFGRREREADRAPWWIGWSRLYRSVEFRVAGLLAPAPVEREHAMRDLFGAVMRESAEQLQAIAPGMVFHVLAFPYTTVEPWVVARLEREGVAFRDHHNLPPDGHGVDALWYGDGPGGGPGHPRALLHGMLAGAMARDIAPLLGGADSVPDRVEVVVDQVDRGGAGVAGAGLAGEVKADDDAP